MQAKTLVNYLDDIRDLSNAQKTTALAIALVDLDILLRTIPSGFHADLVGRIKKDMENIIACKPEQLPK